jgi:hypothetical protein
VEENFTGGGQKIAFGWVRDVYREGKIIYRGGIAPPCLPGGYATMRSRGGSSNDIMGDKDLVYGYKKKNRNVHLSF